MSEPEGSRSKRQLTARQLHATGSGTLTRQPQASPPLAAAAAEAAAAEAAAEAAEAAAAAAAAEAAEAALPPLGSYFSLVSVFARPQRSRLSSKWAQSLLLIFGNFLPAD